MAFPNMIEREEFETKSSLSTSSRNTDTPVSPTASGEEREFEFSLRPKTLAEFVGQEGLKENLTVFMQAAQKREEPIDHVLLYGNPGLGKTTLAHIIANEMSSQIRVTSGPVVEKASDLAGLLTSLQEGDLLFVDEIHRIPKTVEEFLYSAMEDFRIDIMIDQGPNARSVRLDLPKFTLVGATTRTGLLTAPLRSRFTLQTRLDYYTREQLLSIVRRNADLLSLDIDQGGADEIARRARGTPRIVNNLLRFTRDYALERAGGKANAAVTAAALELLEIDQHGLDDMDHRFLRAMAEKHNGGPVGLSSIGAAIGEDAHTLEEVHEPFLVQEGYVVRTPQGRVLAPKGWLAVGLQPPSF